MHTPQVPIKTEQDPHDWIPVRDTTTQAPPPNANQKQQPHVAKPQTTPSANQK